MVDWKEIFNYAILVTGLTEAILGFILSFAIRRLNKWNRSYFMILFSILFVYLSFVFIMHSSLIAHDPNLSMIAEVSMLINWLAASFMMPMLSFLIINSTREYVSWKDSTFLKSIIIVWLIHIIILSSPFFYRLIGHVSEEDQYDRDPLFMLKYIPSILIIAANIIAIYHRRHHLSARKMLVFILYIFFPLVCTIIQSMTPGLLVSTLGYVMSALVVFINMIDDHVKDVINQAQVNAEQQASIRALQMRPHFIYNTLTSIYYLCEQDAEKAQQTILDFSTYLRKNFTAIASTEPVPFNDELEHAKAYLSVEQVRFDGQIDVHYDTAFTAFKLPALTLQPIVENAVKHGIDPSRSPLKISIKTFIKDDIIHLCISNSGSLYEDRDNDDPHIALNNIKERLKLMCGAELEIGTGPDGEGTMVNITLPANSACVLEPLEH